jgi:hypothetical protein
MSTRRSAWSSTTLTTLVVLAGLLIGVFGFPADLVLPASR